MPETQASTICSRRRLLRWAATAAGVGWLRPGSLWAAKPASTTWRQFEQEAADRSPWQQQVDAALAKAAAWLVDGQGEDGSWRSGEYGALRDGASLTPTVCTTLYYLPQGGRATREAFDRGRAFLAGLVDEQGALVEEFYPFPIYSAATASWVAVLGDQDEHARRVQKAWIAFLRRRQFTEALGWSEDDAQFGGWGYTVRPPQKPEAEAAAPLPDANISATLFALGGLSNAQTPLDDPAIIAARRFVTRCQNFARGAESSDEPAFDGGFYFSPTDHARNKAGKIGVGGESSSYRSYGSATADGLRALLRCGYEPAHPRVTAAADWLRRNFSAAHNPGDFAEEHARLRDSYYYYYCWSAAHALLHLGQGPFVQRHDDGASDTDWVKQLTKALLARQSDDGAWRNRFRDAKEDDPLVATPLAAAALAVCRLAEEHQRVVNIRQEAASPTTQSQ